MHFGVQYSENGCFGGFKTLPVTLPIKKDKLYLTRISTESDGEVVEIDLIEKFSVLAHVVRIYASPGLEMTHHKNSVA